MEPTTQPYSLSLLQTLSVPIAIVIAGALIAGAVYMTNDTKRAAAPTAQEENQTIDTAALTLDGRPTIGARDAPVTIVYWYDYQCPFCQRNEQQSVAQIVHEYVASGKVRIVFKSFQFLGPDSDRLCVFAHAVWNVAPDKFYAWHKTIFDNQGVEHSGWADEKTIMNFTTSVLGREEAAQVAALVKKHEAEYQAVADIDESEAAALGITGTPSMIIGSHLLVGAQPYAAAQQLIELSLSEK